MQSKPRLRALVIEDEPLSNELFCLWLRSFSSFQFEATSVERVAEATDEFDRRSYDLVILDRTLPDGDGLDVLRLIRTKANSWSTAVIIVSGRSAERDVVSGLSLGADDCIPKPCSVELFHARLHAVLRRTRFGARPGTLRGPGFELDPEDGRLFVDGRVEHLQPKEIEILLVLMRRPNVIHSAAFICEQAWGMMSAPNNSIEVRLSSLRHKLGRRAGCVETVRGRGYRLVTAG